MDNLSEEITKEIEKEARVDLEKNHKIFKKYLSFFGVVLLLAGSFFLGFQRGQEKQVSQQKNISIEEAFVENKLPSEDKKIDFALFWKVWDLLKEKHIDREKLDAQELVYGAIMGMLKASGDPYTDFFDPEKRKDLIGEIEGNFEGIGAELGIKDNILTIIAPLDESPAQEAGLRSGDKILKVDDRIAADLNIYEAVDLIRGPRGTKVTLTILREGAQETEDVVVTRANIEIRNVKLEFKEDGIVYLRISKFSENVDADFGRAAKEIIAKNSRGIILDLRDNPGGLLSEAIKVSSRMIPEGMVITAEEDSYGKKENLYTAGGDKLSHIPMVVLINEGSASASEILAAALRDNQGITLIGEKSFGKGSVQELVDLPGGSSVKITIAKWLTPRGECIMEKGIEPDVKVELSLDDYKNDRDPQLDKAMEIIKSKISPVQ